jgi:predicted cupin superfamily sugar epimerase
MGCTVAPAFHFEDFDIADKNNMLIAFPKAETMIKKLL